MKVVYMTSDIFAKFTVVSIISMLENNKQNTEIDYILLDDGLTESNSSIISNIFEKYNVNYEIKNVSYAFEKFAKCSPKELGAFNGAKTTWLRLMPDYLFPNYDGIVFYVDSDTIVDGDISELCQLEWGERILCAADVGERFKTELLMEDGEEKMVICRHGSRRYFNAGIILINMNNFLKYKVHDRIIGAINDLSVIRFADQTVYNYILSDDEVLPLACRFNYTYHGRPKYEINGIDQDIPHDERPVIIHYPGYSTRPWYRESTSNMAYLFRKYQDMSPWKGYTESYFDSDHYKQLPIFNRIKERLSIPMYNTPLYALYLYLKRKIFIR